MRRCLWIIPLLVSAACERSERADPRMRDAAANDLRADPGVAPAVSPSNQVPGRAARANDPNPEQGDLRVAFSACPDGKHIGQSRPSPGATCEKVCLAFGFGACVHRAGQADYAACSPKNPEASGSCADVFQPGWSSQCRCR